MTEKEKLEMINLRNRVTAQRIEIKRLQAIIEEMKRKIPPAATDWIRG